MVRTLRLDPAVPIVWRDPATLQLGGDPPRVVLEAVSPAEERMIAALVTGAPRTSLPTLARCTAIEVDELLDRIRPLLLRDPRPQPVVAIRVRGRHHLLVAATARALGLLTRPRIVASRRLGIVAGSHAIPQRDYREWLRRGIPHVGVAFGDESATVSHAVVPGLTACLRCGDLWRRDEEPAWPALATRLVDAPARSALDAILRAQAMSLAARQLEGVPPRGLPPAQHGFRVGVRGTAPLPEALPHPECGCLLDLQRAG